MMQKARSKLSVQAISAIESEASTITESFDPPVVPPDEADQGALAGGKAMEAASNPVPFPLLADYKVYQPLSFPLRQPSDPASALTPKERAWIDIFRKSIPSFRDRAAADSSVADAAKKADQFAERFSGILDDFEKEPESHGGPPDILQLCRLRDVVLREVGFTDIFKSVKDSENAKAMKVLPGLLQRVEEMGEQSARVEFLLKGMLAGNVFDLGATSTIELFDKGDLSFESSFEKLLPRPWVIDHVDAFVNAWKQKLWRKVVIFCDNAGADTVLGVLPFARELVKTGAQVVLAANDQPAINDVTYADLLSLVQEIQVSLEDEALTLALDRGSLLIVNSGSDLPVADLAATSPELAFASDGAELVVLIGMGRGIETNLHADFSCDSLNIGMIKHQEVADYLGGRLYDGVVQYKSVNMPPTPSRAVRQPTALN